MTATATPAATAAGHHKPYSAIRCGWCLDGNHHHCVVVTPLGQGLNKLFRCPCGCNTSGAYTPETPRTRCLTCGRRDVEVDQHDQCIDRDSCAGYVADRRASNPAWQQIEKSRLARAASNNTSKGTRMKTTDATTTQTDKPVKPEAKCLCCGDATKGGLFLPGHDARYVSRQAARIAAGETELLPAMMDALSPHLFAKLTKRVDKIHADTEAKLKAEAKKAAEATPEDQA